MSSQRGLDALRFVIVQVRHDSCQYAHRIRLFSNSFAIAQP
jgi:hypothetical protein